MKDAEAHAEEDRKFHELVQSRNQADSLMHATTKAIADAGDKITAEEKSQLEAAVVALREAVKGDDKALIEAKTKELTDLSGKMAERLYAKPGATEQPQASTEQAAGQSQADSKDNVVDAEFEEVKDKK